MLNSAPSQLIVQPGGKFDKSRSAEHARLFNPDGSEFTGGGGGFKIGESLTVSSNTNQGYVFLPPKTNYVRFEDTFGVQTSSASDWVADQDYAPFTPFALEHEGYRYRIQPDWQEPLTGQPTFDMTGVHPGIDSLTNLGTSFGVLNIDEVDGVPRNKKISVCLHPDDVTYVVGGNPAAPWLDNVVELVFYNATTEPIVFSGDFDGDRRYPVWEANKAFYRTTDVVPVDHLPGKYGLYHVRVNNPGDFSWTGDTPGGQAEWHYTTLKFMRYL